MTDKYINSGIDRPVRIITMEEPSERYAILDVGYTRKGIRIGLVNEQRNQFIDLPPEYAGLIAQALGLAVQKFNEAKEGKQ